MTCCRADTRRPRRGPLASDPPLGGPGVLLTALTGPRLAPGEGGPPLTWGVGSARQTPHSGLPGVRGFPGLRTFSDRTWKVLGQREHLVTPSPRPHPKPETLQLAQERGMEASCASGAVPEGLDRQIWLLPLQASPQVPPEARGANRRAHTHPWTWGPPTSPFWTSRA